MSTEQVLDTIGAEVKGIAEQMNQNSEAVKGVAASMEANQKDMQEIRKEVKQQQEQMDSMLSHIQRSGVKGELKERAELEVKYEKAFTEILRGGDPKQMNIKSLANEYKGALIQVAEKLGDMRTVEEMKTLSTDKIATGGALVPVRMANSIVEKQRDYSDVRQFATVERSDTTGLVMPGEAADFGFAWVGEREERTTEDGGEFYDVELPIMEGRAKVGITNKMQLNGAFDINGYVERKAAQRLARGEGAAFVTGNGHKKPKGFMTYDAGTADGQVQQITTAASTSITHEDLTDLKTPLRGAYRQNARYFMNRFTEGYVEKLEDSAGNPLFNRGNLAAGIPAAIKGFGVQLFDDMAGASEVDGTFAGNELVMLFADMAEFYTIVDHTTSMIMYVDPYTGGDAGKVFFRFHKFVGGGVTNFEAGKILKIKA